MLEKQLSITQIDKFSSWKQMSFKKQAPDLTWDTLLPLHLFLSPYTSTIDSI